MGRYESLLGQESEDNRYGFLHLPETSIPNQGSAPTVDGLAGGIEQLRAALEQAGLAQAVTPNEGIFDKAKDIASGTTSGLANLVLTTLETLDLGRAAVVSGLTEIDDMIRDPEDASWADFGEQARPGVDGETIGVGDWLDDSDLPWAVRSGLGFLGDVALDPTTYLTLGTSAAARPALAAAEVGARELAEGGAEAVAREGAETLAERVAAGGTDALVEHAIGNTALGAADHAPGRLLNARDVARRLLNPSDQLAARFPEEKLRDAAARVLWDRSPASVDSAIRPYLGVDTGLFWGLGRHKVRIPGTELLAERTGRITGAVKRGLFNRLPIPESVQLWPKINELRNASPESALHAFELDLSRRETGYVVDTARSFLHGRLDEVRRDHGEEALRSSELFHAMDEGGGGATGDALRDVLHQSKTIYEEVTGKAVPTFEDYIPYRRTRELLDVIAERGGKGVSDSDPIFRQFRELRDGGEFLGEPLEGPGIAAQIEKIAKDKFGPDYVQVLRDDPLALVGAYIDEVSSGIAESVLFQRLKSRNLLEDFLPADFMEAKRRGLRQLDEGVEGAGEKAERKVIEDRVLDRQGDIAKTGRRGFALGRQVQDLDTAINEGDLEAIAARSAAEDKSIGVGQERWRSHDEANDLIRQSLGETQEISDELLARVVADENVSDTLRRALGGDLSPQVVPDVAVVKGLPHNNGGTYHVPHGTYLTAKTSRGLEVISVHGRSLGVVPDEEAARQLIQDHADEVVRVAREEFDAARSRAAFLAEQGGSYGKPKTVQGQGYYSDGETVSAAGGLRPDDRNLAAQPFAEVGHETVIGNSWRPDPVDDPEAAFAAVRGNLTMKSRRVEKGLHNVDTELGVYTVSRNADKRTWKVVDPYGNTLGTARGLPESRDLIREKAPEVMQQHLALRQRALEVAHKVETDEAVRLSGVINDIEVDSRRITDRMAQLRADGEIEYAQRGVDATGGGKGAVQVEHPESFARRVREAKVVKRVKVIKQTKAPSAGSFVEMRIGDVDANPNTWRTVRGRVDGDSFRRGGQTYINLRTPNGTIKVSMRPNDEGLDSILPLAAQADEATPEVAVLEAAPEAAPVAPTPPRELNAKMQTGARREGNVVRYEIAERPGRRQGYDVLNLRPPEDEIFNVDSPVLRQVMSEADQTGHTLRTEIDTTAYPWHDAGQENIDQFFIEQGWVYEGRALDKPVYSYYPDGPTTNQPFNFRAALPDEGTLPAQVTAIPRQAKVTPAQERELRALVFDGEAGDALSALGVRIEKGRLVSDGGFTGLDARIRSEVENIRDIANDRAAQGTVADRNAAQAMRNGADRLESLVDEAPTPKVKIPSKKDSSYAYHVLEPGPEATIVRADGSEADVVELRPGHRRTDSGSAITVETERELLRMKDEIIKNRTILGDTNGAIDQGFNPSRGLKGERARRLHLASEYEQELVTNRRMLADLDIADRGGVEPRPKKARTREALAQVADERAAKFVEDAQTYDSLRSVFGSAMSHPESTFSRTSNDLRIAELAIEQTKTTDPVVLNRIDHELAARSEAARLYTASSNEVQEELRQVAFLEAQSEDAYAQAIRDRTKLIDVEGRLGRTEARTAKQVRKLEEANSTVRQHFRLEEEGQRYADAYRRGFRDQVFQLNGENRSVLADPLIIDAMRQADELAKPEKIGAILGLHDTLMSRWKGYSLLTPGFHIRNTLGGFFNNGLAGVRAQSYTRWTRAMRQMRQGFNETRSIEAALESIQDPRVRTAVREMFEEDAFHFAGRQGGTRRVYSHGAHVRDLAEAESGNPLRSGLVGTATNTHNNSALVNTLDPSSLDFFALELNRRMGGRVERFLRGPLYLDRRLAGSSKGEALEAVARFHFDYDELSQFESKVVRRVIPFYTWSRKNFPLQIEYMARKPGAYTWWTHARDNLESGSEEQGIVPQYYEDLLAIRLPFTDPRGGPESAGAGVAEGAGPRMYLTLDLPFRDLAQTLDTNQVLSSLSPFIKTPLEVNSGSQFFSGLPFREGLQQTPSTWAPIMPLLQLAHGRFGLPNIRRGADGQYLATEADIYKIESFFPLLGRTRRLLPSESRYDDRVTTTWLSFLGGISTATNNAAAQQGEISRRESDIRDLVRNWRQRYFPATRQGYEAPS
jgi:hypothetical protein